ncbi:MAG: DUF167 domain-containing protein [Candidatus Nanohaloarchaea archaeon]
MPMGSIYVKVRPGSEEFRIEENDFLTVYLEEDAEKGRANSELVSRLEDVLGVKPGIISGHSSRRKKLRADMPADEMKEKMVNHDG